MRNKGKIWAAGIGLAAIIAIVFGVYKYEVNRQQQIDEARTQVEIGILLFKQKDYQGALETLRATPTVGIPDWRNLYYQGASLVQLKKYEEAVVALEEAWSLNQADERIPFALAVAYFKLGNLALSKSYFHAVIKLNPENADAKGLMDIVANLERIQPGESAADVTPPDESNEGTSQ
jgi:Flp pilus assembly protein TadD